MYLSNLQIPSNDIPTVEDVQLEPLHANQLKVEMAWSIIISFVMALVFLGLYFLNPIDAPDLIINIILPPLLLLCIWIPIHTYLAFRKKGYAIREKDIIYQSGLIWRSFTVAPYHRIQHIDVQQGPLERLFGLSQLNIYTAGGSSSDISIGGLSLNKSKNIEYFILGHTATDEEE